MSAALPASEPRLVNIHTDRLSRHAETQIRARVDPHLIAEYAQAMLGGATFPPIVVFEDAMKVLHIGDGWHRADATALAHAKRPERANEILVELYSGSVADALRYAMRANHAHGKRLEQADYARAVQVALYHKLVDVDRAKGLVPALLDLIPGLSARWARECTKEHRAALVAKRNRRIAALHAEGKTQEEIADALDVPRETVRDVIARIGENGANAKIAKPAPPPSPPQIEKPKAVATPEPKPVKLDTEPLVQIDFTPMLPLLDDGAGDDDDEEIGKIDEAPPADDPAALAALAHIDATLVEMFTALEDLTALEGRFSLPAAQAAHLRLLSAGEFLTKLAAYIHEGGLKNAP